jgi:hypothetical protein
MTLGFEILKQFHDTQMLSMINDERKIRHDVMEKLKTVERIAEKETYSQIKMLFLDLEGITV